MSDAVQNKAFEREERYIVIKRKHYTPDQLNALETFMHQLNIQPIHEGVVVEHDWPNYEHVWETVRQVATGEWAALEHAGRGEQNPVMLYHNSPTSMHVDWETLPYGSHYLYAQPSADEQGDQGEVLGERCIDGGKCHHDCQDQGTCFRRKSCSPLPGYEGLWDQSQITAHGNISQREEIARLKKELEKERLRKECSFRHEEILEEENRQLRRQVFKDFGDSEYWIYQGDGEDYPESLTCPVVMSADQLREFMNNNDKAQQAQALYHEAFELLLHIRSDMREHAEREEGLWRHFHVRICHAMTAMIAARSRLGIDND